MRCDTSWAAPTDGDWNVASNWDNGLPGVNGPNACIDEPGTYTVHIGPSQDDSSNATASARRLFLGGESGVQTLEVKAETFFGLTGGAISSRFSAAEPEDGKEGAPMASCSSTTTTSVRSTALRRRK